MRFIIVFAWILVPSLSQGQTADPSMQARLNSAELSTNDSSALDRCLLSYAKVHAMVGPTVGEAPGLSPNQPAFAGGSTPSRQTSVDFERPNTPPKTRLHWCQAALTDQSPAPIMRAMLQATLAGLFLNAGDLVNAQIQLSAAQEINAEHFLVQANLGNLRLYERAFSEAVSAYGTALQGPLTKQDRAAVHFNRALALRAQGDYAGAHTDYTAYLALQTTPTGISPLMTDDDTDLTPTAQSDPAR